MSTRAYTTSLNNTDYSPHSGRNGRDSRNGRNVSSHLSHRRFSDSQSSQGNQRSQKSQSSSARARGYQRYEFDEDDVKQDRPTSTSSVSARVSQARRTRTKKKADRRFDRQYGGNSDMQSFDSLQDDQAAQPRAALYKGEMGSRHRRAARMQTNLSNSASKRRIRTAYGDKASQKPHRFPRRWQVISLVVVAFLVVGCAFLYAPAQQYYQQIRERDRVQAEYEAVQGRNDYIQTQINALSTDEGVADKARADLGWIEPGETLGSVSGLDVDQYTDFVANIIPGSIEAPETWYSGFLDPFFGVGADNESVSDEDSVSADDSDSESLGT